MKMRLEACRAHFVRKTKRSSGQKPRAEGPLNVPEEHLGNVMR